MMKIFATFTVLLSLACFGRAEGSMILFTETVTATGSLGANSFTDALVTLSTIGDTNNITQPSPGFFTLAATTVVSVAGDGTGTFTDDVRVVVNQFNGFGGFSDFTVNAALLGLTNSALFAYDLTTSIGPISGPFRGNRGLGYATTAGTFTIAATSTNPTFTATVLTSAVPEPASLAMMGMGLAGPLAWSRCRGQRSGARRA